MGNSYFNGLRVLGCLIAALFLMSFCKEKEKIYQKTKNGDYSTQQQDLPSARKPDTAFSATDFISNQQPEVAIIPKPVYLEQEEGAFVLTKDARIILLADSLKKTATYLNNYLNKYYGFKLKVKKGIEADTAAHNAIILGNKDMPGKLLGGYFFKSTNNRVLIQGNGAIGTFYGMQTFIQLLPTTPSANMDIAHVKIKDYPRFSYRSLMLDVGRHFFPVSLVKKMIDYLALHKMNIFHWHLTEDQGWRIEIKQYPRLTEIGSTRNPKAGDHNYSGYYTQEEIKEVVKYAQQRYVTIIPEIEIPGHSLAAIASYPALTCAPGNYQVANTGGVYSPVLCPTPYTINFYKNVFDEVMDLFPAKYIHIGGDEAPRSTWNNSAYCKQFLKDHGYNENDLDKIQSYFIHTFKDYLNVNGKKIIGWDEIMNGGADPSVTVQVWHAGREAEAAQGGHNMIVSPQFETYFSRCQDVASDSSCPGKDVQLEVVYNFNPTERVSADQAKYVLGGEACLWTEHVQYPSTAESRVLPRLSALSEDVWTPNDEKNLADFKNRIKVQEKRFDLWDANYYKIQ